MSWDKGLVVGFRPVCALGCVISTLEAELGEFLFLGLRVRCSELQALEGRLGEYQS